MSDRKIHVWLQDIADAIQHIRTFTTDIGFNNFSNDIKIKHAVLCPYY